MCHKKLQDASSTALIVCAINIKCVPTEAISQDGTTYPINILYAKLVVCQGGEGGVALLLSNWNWLIWHGNRIYYASNKYVGECCQESMKTAKDFPSPFKNHLIRSVLSALQSKKLF